MSVPNTVIEVNFIDATTETALGVTQIPAADLPKSFAADTTLHLRGEEWSVVAAQPMTRAEYEQSKHLVLHLHRIETVDSQTILFSLPSICDLIPALDDEVAQASATIRPTMTNGLDSQSWMRRIRLGGALGSEIVGRGFRARRGRIRRVFVPVELVNRRQRPCSEAAALLTA